MRFSSRYAIFLLVLASFNSLAQVKITGKISEQNTLIPLKANVSIVSKKTELVLKFTTSDISGNYIIELPVSRDTLILKVSKMGFESEEKILKNTSQTIDFLLFPKNVELQEVTVKPPPVRKYGDTLSFQVSEFSSLSDRSIGDVISKLPGMETDASGKILYQGKAINRYYINNLNMLDGKYGVVNNNLSYKDVLSVEVFENHQPIRILDSLRLSETAAINIKLKKKVTQSTAMHLGIGAKPFLRDINITPMLFTPNLQFLGSLQSNNIGKEITQQVKSHFQRFDKPELRNWIGIPALLTPPLSLQRWLDNDSHVGTLNMLKKSKNDLELKLNTHLALDKVNQEGSSLINYTLTNEEINYSEKISNRYTNNQFLANLEILKNTSRRYFSNIINIERNWTNDFGANLRPLSEYHHHSNSQNLALSNSLHQIIKKQRNTYNFYSLTNYQESRQKLSVDYTGIDSSKAPLQNLAIHTFYTNNYVEFIKKISSRLNLNIKPSLFFNYNRAESELSNHFLKADTLSQTDWLHFKASTVFSLNFSPKKWLISISSPVSYNYINYKEKGRFSRWNLEPSVYVRLKRSDKLTWYASAGYTNTLSKFGDMYTGFMMTNYLTVIKKDGGFRNNDLYMTRVGLDYADMISGINIHTSYTYSRDIQNLISQNLISPDGYQLITYLEKENRRNNHSIDSRFTKYFFPIKTKLTLGATLFKGNADQYLNGTFLNYTQQAFAPNLSVNNNTFKYLDISYKGTLTISKKPEFNY